MEAIPAVLNTPNNITPSSAAKGGDGDSFKSMLESAGTAQPDSKAAQTGQGQKAAKADQKNAQTDRKAAKADPVQTDPAAIGQKSGPAKSPDPSMLQEENAVTQSSPVLSSAKKTLDAATTKTEQKSVQKKDSKTDPAQAAVLPIPLPPAQAPVKTQSSGKSLSVNETQGKAMQHVIDAPVDSAKPLPAENQPAPVEKKPADIATTGNILPGKPSQGDEQNTVTQSGQIAFQPAHHATYTKPSAKLTVDSPVSSPSWGNELGQKIVWMTTSDQHVAELHLNPPNLGPMEIRLTVQNDQATVQFVSHHQEVRAAIESALPKLREMMMGNGIALGNATVDSGSSQQSAFSQQEKPRQQALSQPLGSAFRVSRLTGAVDTFV